MTTADIPADLKLRNRLARLRIVESIFGTMARNFALRRMRNEHRRLDVEGEQVLVPN